MHEVLLTRGDVQKADPRTQEAIHVRQNCVLVHNDGCHTKAATTVGMGECIRYLIAWEGYKAIQEWLMIMSYDLKGPQVKQARLLLDGVFQEMIGDHQAGVHF